MVDKFSRKQRSLIMSRIGGKHTKPEKKIRRFLGDFGHRFRLYARKLPGNPDIVLPSLRKAIFVHGCFWHGHKNCRRSARPKTNRSFWNAKIEKNIRRDRRVIRQLRSLGWKAMVIWQCKLKNEIGLRERLKKFVNER